MGNHAAAWRGAIRATTRRPAHGNTGEVRRAALCRQGNGLEELAGALSEHIAGSAPWKSYLLEKIHQWKSAGQRIFICSKNQIQQERVGLFLEQLEIKSKIVRTEDLLWNTWLEEQDHHQYDVHLLKKPCFENLALVDEKLIFLKDDDLLGKKSKSKGETPAEFFEKQAKHLTFGDLKPNDYVVHIQHGVPAFATCVQ